MKNQKVKTVVKENLVFIIGDTWGITKGREIFDLLRIKLKPEEADIYYRKEDYFPVLKTSFYDVIIECFAKSNKEGSNYKFVLIGIADDMKMDKKFTTTIRKQRPISQICKLLSQRGVSTK